MNTITGPFEIAGPGGAIPFRPFRVGHGSIDALGFRVGALAYLPDVVSIPDAAWPELHGLDCWIVDALRRTPHPTHAHLDLTLDWIARAAPRQAILTNMHVDMDYETVIRDTPDNVTAAYDGMTLTLPA
jgi:phosphoribosyl 1,2-cyclic phosphate phosphodiesterase